MGVLDELQREADAIAAEKERQATARAAALESAREQIGPRIQAAYKYFDELKKHLLAVNREILARYRIHGAGMVEGLLQGNYGVSTPNPDTLEKFSFRCVCIKSGAFKVSLDDPAAAAAYRDYLRDNGLKAKARDVGRGKAEFLVQHEVPVVVEFSADYERLAIALRVRNLTALGVTVHRLSPEQLDDKFLDELAKAILRTDHCFDEMVGDVLSRTGQIRLKKKIQAVVRQQEVENEQYEPAPTRSNALSKAFSRTLFGRKNGA